MKKILIGSFQCESNTFASHKAKRDDFTIRYGEEALSSLFASGIFRAAGYTCIPMPYAVALPSGPVEREDYLSMLEEFLDVARAHTDADGVYMYFHGAMFVDGIGSGEEYFVARLREVIGKDIPISVASDFHSNVSDGLLAGINAMSGYRTAPHTDYDETETRAANALIRILEENLSTQMIAFRFPALLADVATTAKEPYRTVLEMLARADALPGVVSASLYNGQPWVDAPYVGISVILSCASDYDEVYAAGDAMITYLREHIAEFRFDVPALIPDAAIDAMPAMAKPVFVSDSGDNTTAGADGGSTFLLETLLRRGVKRFLIAPLCLPDIYPQLAALHPGDPVDIVIPVQDAYSKGLRLQGTLKRHGRILGFINEDLGPGALVETPDGDVVISSVRTSFISEEHFTAMGINPADYDYVMLKVGYLWPRTVHLAASQIFCMTPGVSTNDFSTVDFKFLPSGFYYVH